MSSAISKSLHPPKAPRQAWCVHYATRAARKQEVLHRKGQPQQFAVLEYWNDAKVQASHAAAAGTVQAVEKLNSYLAAPIDQRLHTGFVVGKSKVSGRGSVYVLTHVDLIGAKKDEGPAAIKQLNADSVQDAGILPLRRPAAGQPAQSPDAGRGMARKQRP